MRSKDEQERAEAAWDAKAQYNDYRCIVCGNHIIYSERELYFETGGPEGGLCGWCKHMKDKDD